MNEVIAALREAENARVLVCPGAELDSELWSKARAVARGMPSLEAVLVIGNPPAESDKRFLNLDDEMNAHSGDRLVGVKEPGWHDRAALFHTGGTTGVSKLVPQTYLNQINAAWSLAQLFDLSETDVALNGFPLFHVGGTTTIGLSVLAAAGRDVILTQSGSRNPEVLSNIWRLVEFYQATELGVVPTSIGSMTEVLTADCDVSP